MNLHFTRHFENSLSLSAGEVMVSSPADFIIKLEKKLTWLLSPVNQVVFNNPDISNQEMFH